MIEPITGKEHLVQKRKGHLEPYSKEKLYAVALWACNGSHVLATQLVNALDIKLHNKIHISKLYDELINTASNFISDMFPVWEEVAKNLYLLKIHKEVGVKRAQYPEYSEIYATNLKYGFYNDTILTQEEVTILGEAINPEYDKLFGFGGLNLFVQKYCNTLPNGQLLELPQHVYMRAAIQLMYPDGIDAIIAKYHQDASHGVTEATPKLVNGFRPNAQLFSCCLARPEDSQESINIVDDLLGRESKYGGGLASDNSDIRAKGAIVEGNKGKSGGVIPFIQGTQWAVGRYNQGSTRSAAMAMYYNWFHYESPEITELKSESGKDEDRARKLKYAIKWTKHLSEAILGNEDVYLFDPHKTKDMTYAWGDELRALYDKYSKSTHVRKRKYNARELAFHIAKIKLETGNNYTFFLDNANIQNIGGGTVTQSNLCVAGDTKILTQDGYKTIESIAGTTVSCWNGNEWSDTPLFKTSDAEHVLKVRLSNGSILEATEYHKWYVAIQDNLGRLIGSEEKRTIDLDIGDKLIKYSLEPVTHGTIELPNAYDNGFFSADGTELTEHAKAIYLYGNKKDLLKYFSEYMSVTEQKCNDTDTRITLRYKDVLLPKYFVPSSDYSVKSRLEWLAGYLDGDGTLTNNQGTESIQVSSVHREFLHQVFLLLQELGIQSKIVPASPAMYKVMPINDGTGGSKEYWCNASYRLLISGYETQLLLNLGFSARRVQPTRRVYNRTASQFVKVEEVIDEGKVIPVYCGTEPKRHKLMFNGVLTGNCMEYMPNFEPIKHLRDTLVNGQMVREYDGDIALCNLASVNIMKWVLLNSNEKQVFMKLLVTSMDNAIDVSFYANPLGKKHSFNHRNLGIGVSNYANWLATNKWMWDSKEARENTHYLFEELQYYAIAASVELAKERSRYPLYDKSKWAKGLFPHELSILHNMESELNCPLKMDWETLRVELKKYGIRNEYLMAIAPTATSGQCIGATPGVDAPRKLKTIVEGTYSLPFVVPNLRENREYYQTTFNIPNKDTIELAAVRQKFICMGQSVSLAYANPDSAYEVINDIMYAEELGLKSLYYTYTPLPTDLDEVCESCSS